MMLGTRAGHRSMRCDDSSPWRYKNPKYQARHLGAGRRLVFLFLIFLGREPATREGKAF